MVLAHRGAVHPTAPENTLASVERALRQGADGVEVDVRVTADGVPVCHHDADMTRTADDRRQVSTTAYADLPWIGSHRIPRLSEVVDLVAGRGRLVVEVKTPSWPHGPTSEAVEAVVAVLRRHRLDSVTVSSFDRLRLRMLRLHDLGCSTALIGRPAAPYRGVVSHAEQDGHDEVHLHLSTVLAQVAAGGSLRQDGLRVAAWTVDRAEDLHRLRDHGIDAVLSDDLQGARHALAVPVAAAG